MKCEKHNIELEKVFLICKETDGEPNSMMAHYKYICPKCQIIPLTVEEKEREFNKLNCKIHTEKAMIKTPVPCPDGRQGCVMAHYEWVCPECEKETSTVEERLADVEKRLNDVEHKVAKYYSKET